MEAIALDALDSDLVARRGGTAARAPFAVAQPDPPAMMVDRLDHRRAPPGKSPGGIVEHLLVGMMRLGVPAAADRDRQHRVDREKSELGGEAESEQQREQAGRHRGGTDEQQEKAGSDDLGSKHEDAA